MVCMYPLTAALHVYWTASQLAAIPAGVRQTPSYWWLKMFGAWNVRVVLVSGWPGSEAVDGCAVGSCCLGLEGM